MKRRMLIDAAHPEELRVVVAEGNHLEEFDFETTNKKQIKGNIYLARVTRVEPSLQAAFVEYGGNRHGFLAFSEIHPDYYRIPVSDREALLQEQREAADHGDEHDHDDDQDNGSDEDANVSDVEQNSLNVEAADGNGSIPNGNGEAAAATSEEAAAEGDQHVQTVGGDDGEEERTRRRSRSQRHYKIQEVIKRRQIMLVQVTKEERGTKGAALTTYLSLAGRYCVLMPNTPRGGGISRKIANPADRKKMKAILDGLMVPEGMAVILRTAVLERTRTEIRRDLDYLLRLWESIRELTLASHAPTIIHEEANLIKRAIRDLYSRDLEEVLVEGEEGYRTAKAFMRMLMPSHARRVQLYRDEIAPLFHRYQVEKQIEALHSKTVQLKSGGYLVIDSTEALVAIDVNSGRATRERNIEETAYKTNLEAADEAARQLRLRDLAGLIVIDFIDMEEDRHNAAVERRLKEAMKRDRARIQLGHISAFGLLELSRQRLRPSLTEAHFEVSPYCGGTGLIRTVESTALLVLRAIVDEGIREREAEMTVTVPTNLALYLLNQKRAEIAQLEARYGFIIRVEADESLFVPSFTLERKRLRAEARPPVIDAALLMKQTDEAALARSAGEDEAVTDQDYDAEEAEPASEEAARQNGSDEERRGRGRRRGRRRNGDSAEHQIAERATEASIEEQEVAVDGEAETEAKSLDDGDHVADHSSEDNDGVQRKQRRRRGRRGGRGRSRRLEEEAALSDSDLSENQDDREDDPREADGRDEDERSGGDLTPPVEETPAEAHPPEIRMVETVDPSSGSIEPTEPLGEEEGRTTAGSEESPKPRRSRRRRSGTKKSEGQSAVVSRAEASATKTADGFEAAAGMTTADADADDGMQKSTREAVDRRESPPPMAELRREERKESTREGRSHVKARKTSPADRSEANTTGISRRDGDEAQPAENIAAAAAETVNEPPPQPKRGWWRRIIDGS